MASPFNSGKLKPNLLPGDTRDHETFTWWPKVGAYVCVCGRALQSCAKNNLFISIS